MQTKGLRDSKLAPPTRKRPHAQAAKPKTQLDAKLPGNGALPQAPRAPRRPGDPLHLVSALASRG